MTANWSVSVHELGLLFSEVSNAAGELLPIHSDRIEMKFDQNGFVKSTIRSPSMRPIGPHKGDLNASLPTFEINH
jgi:hypothetical protein